MYGQVLREPLDDLANDTDDGADNIYPCAPWEISNKRKHMQEPEEQFENEVVV